jgi:hypothetical protein
MFTKVRNTAMALAALGAIAFGASAVAGAASSSSTTAAKSGSTAAQGSTQNAVPPQRSDETLLTGDTADQVKQAALAKVPGATVIRVETDAQGSPYEAHLRKSDGSLVTVKVDKSYNATSVEDWGGRGGPPPASGSTP